jgi:phosphoribosylanthranilate isomerase
MAEVKICGLSTPDTMQAALEAGADFVGLVFYPKSPRNVSLEKAAALAAQARGQAHIVALTVDADDALIEQIAREVKPDWLQLHGYETPQRMKAVRALSGSKLIKAFRIASSDDLAPVTSFDGAADLILFDAKAPEDLVNALPGGNGLAFDWRLLGNGQGRFMLSGGLNPDNVARAIEVTQAPIVDVSSGVESSPGVKGVNLIRKFIEAAKASG